MCWGAASCAFNSGLTISCGFVGETTVSEACNAVWDILLKGSYTLSGVCIAFDSAGEICLTIDWFCLLGVYEAMLPLSSEVCLEFDCACSAVAGVGATDEPFPDCASTIVDAEPLRALKLIKRRCAAGVVKGL